MKMTIRKKTLLTVGLTFSILLIILTVNLRLVVLNGFLRLESQNVQVNVQRVINTLAEMLKHMDSTAADWAAWNDTYEFSENRNPQYIENNLMDDTLISLKIHFMLFFDEDRRLFFGKNVDLVNEKSIPLTDELTKAVTFAMKAANPRNGGAEKKGILMVGKVPAMVVARPILRSDDTGPARGVLVIGKYLGRDEVKHLSELMRLSVDLYPIEDAQSLFSSDEFQSMQQDAFIQKILDKQFIAGYAVQKNLYGGPAFILKIELPRKIFRQGQTVWYFGIISLVTICLVFSLIILLSLEKLVLSPLNRLSHRVAGIGEKFDSFLPVPVTGKDELGQLAEKINQMLAQIHEKTSQLEEANAALKKDIADRILFEQTLKESEKRYRSILDAVPNAIYICGLQDERIKEINDAFTRITQYPRDEVIGKTLSELNACVDEQVRADIAVQMKKHGQISGMNLSFRLKDGRTMDAILSARRMQYDSEACMVGSIVDDTDRKQAERERNKLEAQLQHSGKLEAIGRLAGGVAHDFNNMLQAIIGHAELSLEGVRHDEQSAESIREIISTANRSADLARQLLAFARKQTIAPRALDLNDTVEGMLKMLRRLIGENINLVWKPGANLWSVKIDPSQIDQILANLSVNARDAIAGVGNLVIETSNVVSDNTYAQAHSGFIPGEYVLLAVSDNGCGMDKKTLDLLFEPFFTTKAIGKGTGLGLATVYGIVKQNNGFIYVYSERGQGTTFKIYIPREKSVPLPAPDHKEGEVKPARGTETVLLVEDEASILDLGKAILERLGYTVFATQNPSVALDLVRSHKGPIHLLITDVVMPEMNGKALRDRIAVLQPGIRVLYISGYTADIIAHHGVIDEGVRFLQKPFSIVNLAAKVREALV